MPRVRAIFSAWAEHRRATARLSMRSRAQPANARCEETTPFVQALLEEDPAKRANPFTKQGEITLEMIEEFVLPDDRSQWIVQVVPKIDVSSSSSAKEGISDALAEAVMKALSVDEKEPEPARQAGSGVAMVERFVTRCAGAAIATTPSMFGYFSRL